VPRDEVLEKFRKVTRRHLTSQAQDGIIRQCERLDTLEDATGLIDALRA
jgi:hypothetical protein